MTEFDVIDLRGGAPGDKRTMSNHSPEAAASAILGEAVIRSGASRNLIAKVYFNNPDGNRNMVRFYRSVESVACA
jgi:hypothetical protein